MAKPCVYNSKSIDSYLLCRQHIPNTLDSNSICGKYVVLRLVAIRRGLWQGNSTNSMCNLIMQANEQFSNLWNRQTDKCRTGSASNFESISKTLKTNSRLLSTARAAICSDSIDSVDGEQCEFNAKGIGGMGVVVVVGSSRNRSRRHNIYA